MSDDICFIYLILQRCSMKAFDSVMNKAMKEGQYSIGFGQVVL